MIRSELARYLRIETVGGAILLVAAATALLWANSPVSASYFALRDVEIGWSAAHLQFTVGTWAQDGLLAVFFFVAGLELKRELVVGELSDRRKALLPIVAACGGVVVPAIIAAAIGFGAPGMDRGWAIPVATDIAFALAVLALTGSRIPPGARVFLLSLAVVDDLLAIILIAALFTASIAAAWLAAAAASLAVYALAQRRRITSPLLYIPLALFTWYAVHSSGVHATLAGVALGLLTRVVADPGEAEAPATRLEHRLQPFSAGVCVPLFALFASGVRIDGSTFAELVTNRVALAIIFGLLVGKTVGIFGVSWLAIKCKIATRPDDLAWKDVFALAVLGAIGFTVSLLVAELSMAGTDEVDIAKAAVLMTSMAASLAGSALLLRRGRVHAARRFPPTQDDDAATDDTTRGVDK